MDIGTIYHKLLKHNHCGYFILCLTFYDKVCKLNTYDYHQHHHLQYSGCTDQLTCDGHISTGHKTKASGLGRGGVLIFHTYKDLHIYVVCTGRFYFKVSVGAVPIFRLQERLVDSAV